VDVDPVGKSITCRYNKPFRGHSDEFTGREFNVPYDVLVVAVSLLGNKCCVKPLLQHGCCSLLSNIELCSKKCIGNIAASPQAAPQLCHCSGQGAWHHVMYSLSTCVI